MFFHARTVLWEGKLSLLERCPRFRGGVQKRVPIYLVSKVTTAWFVASGHIKEKNLLSCVYTAFSLGPASIQCSYTHNQRYS